MNPPAAALAMMGNSGLSEDGSEDPRTQLMKAMVLSQMQGGQQQNSADHGPDGESGGEVGARHIDQGTTPPHGSTDDLEARGASAHTSLANTLQKSQTPPPPSAMDTPLPTTFPSTARKEQAHTLLEKAQSDPSAQPFGTRHRILSMVAPFIPIAGPAMLATEGVRYRQAQNKIGLAREEYNTESGLEERERDQALRGKVAMSNIENARAMKELLVGMQERGQDLRAGTGHERNEVTAAGKGYDLGTGPNGQTTVTPRQPGDLSEVMRRSMDVQQATTDLKKAQTLAIPEQIKIKEASLKLAQSRLDAYLQNTEFNQDTKREGMDFRESGPTTMMRDRSQQANIIGETSKQLVQDITTMKDHIGPVMGRYGTLTDFIGNPPPEFARLASELTTYIALQPAAHGFKGLRAVQEFEKSIGTPIRTPEALINAIGGNVQGLQPMMGAGEWTPPVRATPRSMAAPRLQKKPGATHGAPSGGASNGARVVQRDAQGNLQFAQQ